MNKRSTPSKSSGVDAGKPSRSSARLLAEVDEIEVTIEKLVAGGDGLARWQGVPVFIPRSAPGDRLRVKLVERRPDYGRAEILQILEPGPGRREPPCSHFGRCGGCDLQHLEDELQTRHKAAAVLETLVRLGGLEVDGALEIVRGPAWAYRQRAQVHAVRDGEELRVGFRTRRGHDLVPVEMCPILIPELERSVVDLAKVLPDEPPGRIDLVVGDEGELSSAPKISGLPHGEISIEVGEMRLQLDARCFFQAHRQLLTELVQRVVGPWQGRSAVDLYAGVGLFSLPLAKLYDEVVAVEGDSVAARFLKKNARLNRLDRLRWVRSAVESWIRHLPERVDRVVVDPPRAGLSRGVSNTLCARRPRRLTYVSCHPATLACDLKVLQQVFSIEKILLVDLFPQTGHMEVVAHLVGR